MAKQVMRNFVEKCLPWHRGNRIDSHLADTAFGISLAVAVDHLERNFPNIQHAKRLCFVPLRRPFLRLESFAFRLVETEPVALHQKDHVSATVPPEVFRPCPFS
ncbi:hypothetical protein [Candidatus Skiveiella danica]|uniref:hypothetical protein n=1 Tax=Candidatus Skiveiella danica TaxID=3386177 RepID=UPI0039B8AB19